SDRRCDLYSTNLRLFQGDACRRLTGDEMATNLIMPTMQTRKTTPRAAYRLGVTERILASPTLAARFPRLKALTINIEFFDSGGLTRNGGMKYKPNLEKAKAMVCFDCPSGECVGGDYDVSEELRRAIAAG